MNRAVLIETLTAAFMFYLAAKNLESHPGWAVLFTIFGWIDVVKAAIFWNNPPQES